MSYPPNDVPATSLYSKLSTTPRPFKVVDFPRLDDAGKPIGQIAIRALNGSEFLSANVDAEAFARSQFKTGTKEQVGYLQCYESALKIEQLMRALRDPDDATKPVFPSAQALRSVLTTEEIGALYLLFLDVTEQIGPVLNAMTGAEIDAWIDRLAEGGERADADSFLSSGQWRTLAHTLASRLGTLRMQLSSSGTQLDARTESASPLADNSDIVTSAPDDETGGAA